MKGAEVNKLNDAELTTEVARLRNDLFDMRTQSVTQKVEDTSKFKKTRKDIARVLTEQSTRANGKKA
jgi:large subunit ribosomal protein L29